MKVFIVAVLLLSIAVPGMVAAQVFDENKFRDNNSDTFTLAQKKKLSPSEAAKQAQRQYGGKVIGSPKCRETDSGTVCSVRLDIDGRIKTVTIRG